jgi:hypothetical protein
MCTKCNFFFKIDEETNHDPDFPGDEILQASKCLEDFEYNELMETFSSEAMKAKLPEYWPSNRKWPIRSKLLKKRLHQSAVVAQYVRTSDSDKLGPVVEEDSWASWWARCLVPILAIVWTAASTVRSLFQKIQTTMTVTTATHYISSLFSALLTRDSSATITSTSHNERFIPPSTTYDDLGNDDFVEYYDDNIDDDNINNIVAVEVEEIALVPSAVFSDEKTGDALGSEWICGLRRSCRRRQLLQRSQPKLGSVVVGGLRRSSRFL